MRLILVWPIAGVGLSTLVRWSDTVFGGDDPAELAGLRAVAPRTAWVWILFFFIGVALPGLAFFLPLGRGIGIWALGSFLLWAAAVLRALPLLWWGKSPSQGIREVAEIGWLGWALSLAAVVLSIAWVALGAVSSVQPVFLQRGF